MNNEAKSDHDLSPHSRRRKQKRSFQKELEEKYKVGDP